MKPSLAHDAEPEAYAEAMIKCQAYAPACSDAGECALEGWCFGRDGGGFAVAHREIQKLLLAEDNIFVRSWLKLALDALDHRRFIGNRALDVMRLLEINKRVRREYNAAP